MTCSQHNLFHHLILEKCNVISNYSEVQTLRTRQTDELLWNSFSWFLKEETEFFLCKAPVFIGERWTEEKCIIKDNWWSIKNFDIFNFNLEVIINWLECHSVFSEKNCLQFINNNKRLQSFLLMMKDTTLVQQTIICNKFDFIQTFKKLIYLRICYHFSTWL